MHTIREELFKWESEQCRSQDALFGEALKEIECRSGNAGECMNTYLFTDKELVLLNCRTCLAMGSRKVAPVSDIVV